MPFRNNPHGAPGKDHGCDRSEVLMSIRLCGPSTITLIP